MSFRERVALALQRPLVAVLVQAAVVLLVLAGGWWGVGKLWPELLALDRPPAPWWLVAAGGLYTLALALAIVGWRWVLRVLDVRRRWLEDATFYTLSLAARRLPGGIWGPVGRVYLYRQAGAPTARVAAATVLDHVLVVATALALAPPALAALPLRTVGAAWLVLALAAVPWLLLLVPRCRAWLVERMVRRGLLPAESSTQSPRWLWAGIGGVYALVWLSGGLSLAAIVRAFGSSDVDPWPVVAAWILARGAALPLAILPAGFGASDLALALLLGYAMPAPVALASALAVRALVTVGEAGWALALLTVSHVPRIIQSTARRADAGVRRGAERGEDWVR